VVLVAAQPAKPTETTERCCRHPLARSMADVNDTVTSLSVEMLDLSGSAWPPPPWIGCDRALSDPSFFSRWQMMVTQRLMRRYAPTQDRAGVPDRTTAGYVLRCYLVIPSYLGALLFHSARRVPCLAPQQLGFRLDAAAVTGIALRPGRFWCLDSDPEAEHRDALPVAHEAALGAMLREQAIAHAARFLAVYGPLVRFGCHAQWATVTDMLDKALLFAGQSFGSPQAGAVDAQLVLGGAEKPLTSSSTICQVIDDNGCAHWIRRRGTCCFLYAMPGVERPCASCPRIDAAKRSQILATVNHAQDICNS
jgi:FhuF 2Fe-2S C-terminal domain